MWNFYERPFQTPPAQRYGYPQDSQVCATSTPDVLIVVHSEANNFYDRLMIRFTWAAPRYRTINGIHFRTVFFLGVPGELSWKWNSSGTHSSHMTSDLLNLGIKRRDRAGVIAKIKEESKQYGDIVQGNFTEAYRNLTIKNIMVMNWVLSRCPKIQYILKVDTDVVVNLHNVVRFIQHRSHNNTGLLLCSQMKAKPAIRSTSSKWYVTENEYPFSYYPPWCLGFGILMSRDVVQQLYLASRDVRAFWIDDVYVTGFLAMKAGVQVTALGGNHTAQLGGKFKADSVNAMFTLADFFKINTTAFRYWEQLVTSQTL
ncbi:beta-1,3-galactosyltransferase 5 [Aplysia californica]|uniref:Hexosyltransferase n=1 Tax=Aplysia californica TaxID=6500 RepID=A0ABM1VU10_APLCA|nr:beta-1,3-galactosyltransferase 5 [Aplysia californica]